MIRCGSAGRKRRRFGIEHPTGGCERFPSVFLARFLSYPIEADQDWGFSG